MVTTRDSREVMPRRRAFALSFWTLSSIVAMRTGIVLTQSGVATRRHRTTVAGATVRRVILALQSLAAHTLTAASLLSKVVTSRRNRTSLHRTLVCVTVGTSVALPLSRVGARGSRTGVRRVAVRRVVLANLSVRARGCAAFVRFGEVKTRGGTCARSRWTIGTTDVMLPGKISPNRGLRAVRHTTTVSGAAVRNVESTKCGVGTLRSLAAVDCRQIVTMRGGSACNRGARVRVAMGSRIPHPDTGISTRFRRALVGQTPARAVVET